MRGKLFSLILITVLLQCIKIHEAVPVPETSVEQSVKSLKFEFETKNSEEDNEHYKEIMALLDDDLPDLIKYFATEDKKIMTSVLEKTDTADMTDAMKEERKSIEDIINSMKDFVTSTSDNQLNELYLIFKKSLRVMKKYDFVHLKDPTPEQLTIANVMKDNGARELVMEFKRRLDIFAAKINTAVLGFTKDYKPEDPNVVAQVENWHKYYEETKCLFKKFDIFASFMETILN
ncbi:uncharacterized protein LOC119689825 [Teleopsis dalmanni]|uniref:uncharacterized protein LOC119689825 n=1 Tax=Teleopsis dalmanni TaxID=139649 RepID=UPI0018CF76D0|nr:uncharacterized protein LOC119689825 [Teleopsis dalmanni]